MHRNTWWLEIDEPTAARLTALAKKLDRER